MTDNSQADRFEVAIIGAGMNFPGGIDDFRSLWDFMIKGREASGEVPEDRWSNARFYSPDPKAPGKTAMHSGNFLRKSRELFDPALFGLSPREASFIDPLQRLGLQTAHRALESAGITPTRIKGAKCGVYMGTFALDFYAYVARPALRPLTSDHFGTTAITATMVSARINHVFDLRGTAVSLDTACSSSLTAIHLACESLKSGEWDMALAGGVSAMLIPETSIGMTSGGFISSDGRSKSFSANADGYGRGEGCGIVLLKPLKKAVRDGDKILGVISSTAQNHDGRTPGGVSVPSQSAQEALIRTVMNKAGVQPSDLGAVEAHGTGTSIGDPIEARAVSKIVGRKENPLPIGSVKSHIGHLEAAAGIAGLLRATAELDNGTVAPWNLDDAPSKSIDWENCGLMLPREPVELKPEQRILVNSFGYGGTNVAAIMRKSTQTEWQENKRVYARRLADISRGFPYPAQGKRERLLLSAHSDEGLKKLGREWRAYLEDISARYAHLENDAVFWRYLCVRNASERELYPRRVAVTAADMNGVLEALRALENGENSPALSWDDWLTPDKAMGDARPLETVSELDDTESLLRLMDDGTGVNEEDAYFTYPQFDLPYYPQGLERTPWPVAPIAEADRRDMSVHPVLGTPSFGAKKGWLADATLGFMPWLSEHAFKSRRRQEKWVFPASAYVEAGLAATRELNSEIGVLVLENLNLTRPFLPEPSQTSRLSWEFDEDTRVLSFFSQAVSGEESWQGHGGVRLPAIEHRLHRTLAQESEITDAWESLNAANVYDSFRRRGLQYGKNFQRLTEIKRSGTGAGSRVAAQLKPLDVQAWGEGRRAYIMHPALLDAAWQSLEVLLPPQEAGAFVPVSIERFSFDSARDPRGNLTVRGSVRELDATRMLADVRIYDTEGVCVAETLGLECRASNDQAGRSLLLRTDYESLPQLPLLAEIRQLAFIGSLSETARKSAELLSENGAKISYFEDVESYLSAESDIKQIVWFPDISGDGDFLTRTSALVNDFRRLAKHAKTDKAVTVVSAGLLYRDAVQENALKASPLAGYARSLRAELGSASAYRLISLSETTQRENVAFNTQGAEDNFVPFDVSYMLAAELAAEQGGECEIHLSSEGRYAPRLAFADDLRSVDAQSYDLNNLSEAVRLGDPKARKNTLEAFQWHLEKVSAPKAREITVRTLYASLNFKDLLKIAGMLPESVTRATHNGELLGMEALVEVEAVGSDVTEFRVGERYISMAPGAFVSRRVLNVDKTLFLPLPTNEDNRFTLPELTALPVVSVTAYASLIRLGRLKKGETVLIHSAAGGVGQVAVRIALALGAKVFATAGTEEKRRHLLEQGCEAVWSSRTLEFTDGVMRATNGRGVDVAVSSLGSEGLLATLKIMAPNGRLIEIGKQAAIENLSLGMAIFNGNLSFHAFDLDRLSTQDPDLLFQDIADVGDLFLQMGIESPPVEIFPASKSQDAFRHFASGKHIGKIVLDFTEKGLEGIKPKALKEGLPEIRDDLFYLITGGTRGFGLETAKWLLGKGARAIALLSRGTPHGEDEIKLDRFLSDAADKNCAVELFEGDVSDADFVKSVLSTIAVDDKVGGIYHSAGIIKDGFDLTAQDITDVLTPKLGGARALRNACDDLGVDPGYFVFYSSAVAILGNIGQTAYGAACAFEDAYATWLNAQGIRAYSVAWGAISEGGMFEGNERAKLLFEYGGVIPLAAQAALADMERLFERGVKTGLCAKVDWQAIESSISALARQMRFARLTTGDDKGYGALLALPPQERAEFITKTMTDELKRVLKLDVEELDLDMPVVDLGLDSLAALELQVALEKRLGVEAPMALLSRAENDTIGGLAQAFVDHFATVSAEL